MGPRPPLAVAKSSSSDGVTKVHLRAILPGPDTFSDRTHAMLRHCLMLLLLFGVASSATAQTATSPAPTPQTTVPESPAVPTSPGTTPGPQAAPAPQAPEAPKGPKLADLMKLGAYRGAWEAMLRAETLPPPEWITSYASTLDSPPIPSFGVLVGSLPYTMAFNCKPNDCENHQLFVLFAPEGRHAWALLLSAGSAPRWFGNPDDEIKDAIKSGIE